jgi:hypothetical protein
MFFFSVFSLRVSFKKKKKRFLSNETCLHRWEFPCVKRKTAHVERGNKAGNAPFFFFSRFAVEFPFEVLQWNTYVYIHSFPTDFLFVSSSWWWDLNLMQFLITSMKKPIKNESSWKAATQMGATFITEFFFPSRHVNSAGREKQKERITLFWGAEMCWATDTCARGSLRKVRALTPLEWSQKPTHLLNRGSSALLAAAFFFF